MFALFVSIYHLRHWRGFGSLVNLCQKKFRIRMKNAVADRAVAVGHRLVDLVFPPVCCGCGRLVAQTRALCPACWAGISFIEKPYCAVLGRPFSQDLGAGFLSAEAIANPPDFDQLRSATVHDHVARQMVHGLKYRDRTDLAPMMAEWMIRASDGALEEADLILPVPLHRFRLMSRRFNQAAELARQIAHKTSVSLLPDALYRSRQTKRQVGLGLKAREDNVRGAFKVTETGRGQIFGKRVVLVDDVYTTGATANAAARSLRRAGAAHITVLTFAMALPPTI
jgi:ComF family protein